jgi:hypothetical protein
MREATENRIDHTSIGVVGLVLYAKLAKRLVEHFLHVVLITAKAEVISYSVIENPKL